MECNILNGPPFGVRDCYTIPKTIQASSKVQKKQKLLRAWNNNKMQLVLKQL